MLFLNYITLIKAIEIVTTLLHFGNITLTCNCSQSHLQRNLPNTALTPHLLHRCEHCGLIQISSPHSAAPCLSVKEQHRRLGRVRLQPERHHAGLQRTLPFPGEPSLHLAAHSQPHPQLPGGLKALRSASAATFKPCNDEILMTRDGNSRWCFMAEKHTRTRSGLVMGCTEILMGARSIVMALLH